MDGKRHGSQRPFREVSNQGAGLKGYGADLMTTAHRDPHIRESATVCTMQAIAIRCSIVANGHDGGRRRRQMASFSTRLVLYFNQKATSPVLFKLPF
jgi:hypothetical protein